MVTPSKRFLFLDDDPRRHAAFDRILIGSGARVVHVTTAAECEEALEAEEPFDCVFLDHDLGGRAFVKEVEETGSQVAFYIRDELSPSRYPKSVCVHSWNAAGAERMCSAIEEAGIPVRKVPFQFPSSKL